MYLKAWHFCLLFFFLTTVLYILELKKTPAYITGYDSCVTELEKEIIQDRISSNLCFVLYYDVNSPAHHKMEYNMHQFASQFPLNASFYKINLTECYPECKHLNISGTPSLLIFQDGKEIGRTMGVVPVSNLNNIYKRIALATLK